MQLEGGPCRGVARIAQQRVPAPSLRPSRSRVCATVSSAAAAPSISASRSTAPHSAPSARSAATAT